MAKDSSDSVEKKPQEEVHETPFDVLGLMREGHDRAEPIRQPTEGEQAHMLRHPEIYAAVAAKRDAAYEDARQALDRGDDGPAQRLIKSNKEQIEKMTALVTSIEDRLKQYDHDLG